MKKSRLFSIISFLVLIAVSVLFAYYVYRSQLIPARLLLLALILYIIVLCLLVLLVFRSKQSFLVILGGVLCLLLCVVLLASTMYFNRAVNAAQTITTTKTEVSTVSVYMLSEKTDDSTALSTDLTYGILKEQDRANTDKVISKLEEELGSTLITKSFDSTSGLINALLDQDVDAIIVNSAFLQLFNEVEGYENLASQLREIHKVQVITEKKEDHPSPAQNTKPVSSTPNPEKDTEIAPFIVYISGIDTRGTEMIEKSRSDVNVLAVINPNTHQILLLTTPRDYYVTLQFDGYQSYIKDKLTHAGMYGVQVSMDTLGLLYDIDVDYYFRVNFTGFVDIVNALGGVTVDSEKEFWEEYGGRDYHFLEGPNQLNGEDALVFVRARKNIGDQQRGRNHMSFIKAVIDKATSSDMLTNFDNIVKSVEGSFETSMPYELIRDLVKKQIESSPDWNIVSYNVTGDGASANVYSMDIDVFVFLPDIRTVNTAKELIQQVLNGEILTAPEATPAP
ncbi:MAG: LCP family protein [Oscillospiraceae bacterium]|nr:LCP family protein [Oscillospiraceae bacterium]